MLVPEHNGGRELTSEARLFAQKVARSIVEIESNINNTADVVVLLEVLGYSKDLVMKYGFNDFFDLANYVYDFIDAYENREKSKEDFIKTFTIPIAGITQRIVEGIGLIFPWLGSLVLLFLTGISLWMAWGLRPDISTALVIGVFLGLVVSEGISQVFGRLFTFYHEQTNLGEMKRVLKRSYLLLSVILVGTIVCLFSYAFFSHIPMKLVTISTLATVTISLHRTSYVVMFGLKKIAHLILSYSAAFAALLSVYFLSSSLIPDAVVRYFVALGAAFVVLSVFAVYHNLKIISKSSSKISLENPHFYKPRAQTDKTLRSKFSVQLWESLPTFLFGTFYFIMMFSDRIISWSFNHLKVNGIILPLGFNSVYHIGADLALSVMLPASVIQYVMAGPIYKRINNLIVTHKVTEMEKIHQFIQKTYRRIVTVSILASVITAVVINLAVTQIPAYQGAAQDSIQVLHIASVGNVLLSIFSVNSVFILLVNRTKSLVVMAIISAMVVSLGGIILGKFGLEYITLSYLASAALAATFSTIYLRKIFKKIPSIFFSRSI
jgi:hypothetical protein